VRKQFLLPQDEVARCIVHGQAHQYAVEVTHRCVGRQALYEELTSITPGMLQDHGGCWFRTLNKESNPGTTCLFDGVRLELNVQSGPYPEIGFCFPRTSFVFERDQFRILDQRTGVFEGWIQRAPIDSERLRVNKQGYEVLYFVQPPPHKHKVTLNDVRQELSDSLKLNDPTRLSLTSGPFLWTAEFQDDGRDMYSVYFNKNIVVDSRHMKTTRGSALIYVLEERSFSPGQPFAGRTV